MFSRSISVLRTVKRLTIPAKTLAQYQKHAALAFIGLKMQSFCSAQQSDPHHDSKPQIKVEPESDNVFQQIDKVYRYFFM